MKIYDGKIDINNNETTWIKIIEWISENSKVLDVGCGTGFLGEFLIRDRKCDLYGVEINPEAAIKAKKYYEKVIVGDIENANIFRQIQSYSFFDFIILSNILEHLINPAIIMEIIKKILSENGFVIIAVPNIAHWSIRFKLLLGKFEYKDSGILDNTHLRFFTLKSATGLIKNAGYKIQSIKYISAMPRKLGPLRKMLVNLFPGFFCRQFLFLMRVNKQNI